MKTKMKGKGKAIIGIAMAAIMLASVFAAMVPMASADDPVGKEREVSASDLSVYTIFIGEKLNVTGINASSSVKFTKTTTPNEGYIMTMTAATGKTYAVRKITSAIIKVGKYNVEYENPNGTTVTTMTAYFDTPSLIIEIQDEFEEEVEATTAGTPLTIDIDTNLPDDDVVKVKIQDPDGYKTTHEQDKLGNLSYPDYSIDTEDWESGEYKIWLATVDDKARGLDKESEKETITIYKKEITIEADNEEPVVAEKVLITVRAPPYTPFDFKTSHPDDVDMQDLEDNPLANEPRVYNPDNGTFKGKVDENGIYKFVVKFTDDRTFTFDVWYYDGTKRYDDDIELDVEKADVVFDMPATVLIGEDLTIKGTITEGESVTIYIDDKTWGKFEDARVTDGVFEEDWDTKGEKTGSYRIDVYIDLVDKMDTIPGDKDDLDAGIDEDGTTSVRLIEPGLSAEQPRDVIAEEDDYVVEGTATGVGDVDIVIIGPDGYDKRGDDEDYGNLEDGLLIETESADSDNLFEAEIDTGDADSGKYLVLVLTPGRDGGYGIYGADEYGDGQLEKLLKEVYPGGFDGKSKAQILSMITSVTSEETATDDLMEVLEFTIESPYVELDTIEDVGLGEPLIISGTTNREDETVIMITLTGPVETSATAEVKDCKFNVTIDTTDLLVGPYTVEADDGDGHIDTATVEILEEAAPTPTPEVEVTPTPEVEVTPTSVPTAEPTAEPTPTPTPTPGFEAVFAIAGMLSIAYLVLRKRRE